MMTPELESALEQLVAAVGGPDPLPAGGAAGVASLAMGAALGIKILRLSGGGEGAAALEQLLKKVTPQFRADCEAFGGLLSSFQLAGDDPARAGAIRSAWREATAAPASVARLAAQVEERLEGSRSHVKSGLQGDLIAALELTRAGRRIACHNARENAEHLDPAEAEKLLAGLPCESQTRSS